MNQSNASKLFSKIGKVILTVFKCRNVDEQRRKIEEMDSI